MNNKEIISGEEVVALLKEPGKWGLENIEIDDDLRIFKNGVLNTSILKVYSLYWKNKSDFVNQLLYKSKIEYEQMLYSVDAQYLGKDLSNNLYWLCGAYILICTSDGMFIDFLYQYNAMYIAKTFPAIHPSGDIYFLDYDDKAVYLYRIKNVWDPEGREAWYRTNAYVTAKELKLRDRGSLDGAQIGMLEEWQRVEIVDRAKASTNIAGVEGRWCKVKTMDGRVGWAFGGYLKEDED